MDWLYKLFCCCKEKPTHKRGNTTIDIHEALKMPIEVKEKKLAKYKSMPDQH